MSLENKTLLKHLNINFFIKIYSFPSVLMYIFYSIQFFSIVLYCIVLYCILFYSILLYSILFYSILFYYIMFYSILFYSILFYCKVRLQVWGWNRLRPNRGLDIKTFYPSPNPVPGAWSWMRSWRLGSVQLRTRAARRLMVALRILSGIHQSL